jgi:hypothetical protein
MSANEGFCQVHLSAMAMSTGCSNKEAVLLEYFRYLTLNNRYIFKPFLQHDADARSRRDFFLEGSAMGQFNDPNVIHLEGVVTKSEFKL